MRIPPKGTLARETAEFDVHVRRLKRSFWVMVTPPLERIIRVIDRWTR